MLQSCLINATTPEELSDNLINKLLPQLQKLIVEITPQVIEPEALLTKKQATEFLQISLPTLNNLIKNGALPCYRIANTLRIKKSDILKSLVPVRNNKYSRHVIENSS